MRSHAGLRDAQGRTFAEYLNDQISAAIFRSGMSIRQAAAESGINHMTLHRSLSGDRVFNADDIGCIAQALDVTPAALMNAEGFEPA